MDAPSPRPDPFGPPVERQRPSLPQGSDFWVFGYGSLMWHPGFPHLEVRPTLVYGFHRRFCVYSHRYRGTPDKPGLVLGLTRGGSCHGLAYRVPCAEGPAVLDYLWEREMVTGVYIPRWLDCRSAAGPLSALAFVVDPAHRQYSGKLSLEETAALVVQGCGHRGSCSEYLANTLRHLEALGIHDRPLNRLAKAVAARCAG